jgi:hypothetical protein
MIAAGFGRWPTMTLAAIGDALVPIHQRILPSYFDLSPVGGLAAVALIAFGLLLSKQRRWGRVAFGAAWLLLFSLAPLFSLVDVALESRLPMPLIGLLLVLLEIDGLDDLGRRPVVAAAVVVAIAALFYASGQYQPSFRDARAVAARALADSPRSAPE